MLITHPARLAKASKRHYMDRAATKHEAAMRRAFLKAVEQLRNGSDIKLVELQIARGDWGHLGFNWQGFEASFGNSASDAILSAMRSGAEAEAKHLSKRLGVKASVAKIFPAGDIRFDLKNPHAIRAAALQAARLVRNVTRESQSAIRRIIERAQRDGISVRDQSERIAKILLDELGLTDQQMNALYNLEQKWSEQGISPDVQERMWRAQRDRFIRHRAEVIARNETMKAANAGQQEIWSQARDTGMIATDTQRRWLTAKDERTCSICRPLDGKVSVLDGTFTSEGFTEEHPPIHVQCRCVLTLVIE